MHNTEAVTVDKLLQTMNYAEARLRSKLGDSYGVQAYFAINYININQIFIRVGTDSNNGLRLYLKLEEFDWPDVRRQIIATCDELLANVWSHNDVGRTLGIEPGQPIAAE